jgi:hypothetical protein
MEQTIMQTGSVLQEKQKNPIMHKRESSCLEFGKFTQNVWREQKLVVI